MHQLTNRIKTATLPRRLLFALRGAKSLHLTNVLVLLLCYSIVLQPNAALAAQTKHTLALATVNQRSETKNLPPAETNSAKRSNTSGLLTGLSNLFSSSAPEPPPPNVATITDAVVSRHKPLLGNGRIEGSLRVLLGESFSVSNNTNLLGDLYLPGTPSIQLGTGAQHGGTVNDGGAATPSNYYLTLNNNANLPGRIHTRADAVALPADFPNSVPASAGTRSVTVRSQSDIAAIGNWQTVRDLNVAGSRLTVNMPPGNYGTLTVNGNSQVNFSAGIYNFRNTINLDGSATLQSTGLVTINVAQVLTINSGALTLGSYTAPADVHLNVLGALLKINGSSQVSGMVRAYNATVSLNGTSQLRGQVIANTFSLNGGKVIGAVWPAQSGSSLTIFGPRRFDRTTGQPNQYVEQFSLPAGVTAPYTLHIQNGSVDGGSRVSSATVKLNGIDLVTPSDLNQNVAGLDRTVTFAANNQLDVRLASDPGSYLIININGVIVVGDSTPPVVAINSPTNNTTTGDAQIAVSGTATDTGTGATGVAHVYVNDVEATYTAANNSWSLASVPLNVGANQIIARAVDQAGNPATASITVTRQAPVNHAPEVNAGDDQNLTLPQTAALHGTASDDGLPQGSTLTTTWSMVSGEGTVTFADELAKDTTATFSTAGTYVLRLTASDSLLSVNDEITVTVQPQNQPPTVTAGANQTIALPRNAALNGTVTDDGLPTGGVLSIAWSQVSGPGVVTFEDPTKAETIAAFSLPGDYVLRLWASDSELTSTGELAITVQPQNQAPTVASGPDQILVLPNFAQLNGTVSDDGWPANSSVTTLWTVVSGPAPVVIDNPNVTVTLAKFSAPGPYVFRLSAGDTELSSFDELTINVTTPPDTVAPILTITSPADNSSSQDETTTVSGTVSDPGQYPSGVASVTVNNVPAVVNSDGNWTAANVALTVGPNTITAHALDNAGNPSDRSITITRQPPPDTTSPTLVITSPTNSSTTQDETITVSGTVSDPGLYPSGIAHITVNGVSVTIAPDGSWSISGVALTVGSNTIAVHVEDNAGNPADQSISVTRQPPPDTTGPTLAITSPGDGSTTQQETITVSGTVADPGQYASGVASVTVNDIAATLDVNAGTWTVSNVPLPALGSHAIVARAVDVAGNPSTPQTIHITRQAPPDVIAPTLAITSPNDGYSTLAETITVSGTVSDPGQYATGVASVTVNGATASLDLQAGSWTVSGVALAIGQTVVTATAVDNAGNPNSQSITITRNTPPDTQAPTIAITAPLNNSVTPNATITVTGTAIDEGAYATGVRRVVVNGQIASYDPATHQWIAADVPLNEGPNTIQVFADDNAPVPNPTETSVSVTRHTPDTRPPTVTITSPSPSLETYDATVIVTGTAVDDGLNATGVDHVTVNGATASFDAATGQWSVAAVALAYGDNTIVVVATDKAPTPNQGTAQVQVSRIKIPPPTLTISNPQNGAVLAATSITVAGSVSSMGNTPTVTVNGETAVVSGGQFARTVPLVEGANAITVVATDSIQQPTQASLSIIRDMLPPAVNFANVPASVQPGGTYQILVDATDNVGVADVEFRVNGQYVATSPVAPYEFTLAVPTVYAAGTNLVLSAVARDLTNTTAVATAQTRSGGPGGVSGYVFDDATGYVLPGVNASLNNQSPMVTDELGVFNLVSTSPSGVVRLSKDGHTPVDRLYSVSIGEGTALFDARLTPLDSHPNNIGVAGGAASGDSGRIQVTVAPGSLADTTDLRVTSISPQGLENLLPYGWSPVPGAVVDLRTATGGTSQSLASPAHLAISQVAGLNAATPLALARYDDTSHRWMVVAAGIYATSDGENGSLSADLARLGQYAFLVADTGATAPPAAVPGQPLTASQPADSAALNAAQASAVASPRTAVFSSSARSAISFFATSPTQLPSGVSIEATFGETYNLLGGRDSVLVDRPAQDFVLYAYPAASAAQPNRLGAFFIAKPTRTDFTITELFNANVHVDIRSGRQSQVGALIDGGGGSVRAGNGSELIIPANALSGSQSVFFEDLPTNVAGVTLPDGYEIVGAFDLDLGSATLSASATISLPGVTGDLARIVVARLMTVGGARSPKVVARAASDANGKLSSTVSPPLVPAGVSLSGIRSSGRYVFIRVPQAFGYVKGSVNDAAGGNPLGMVKVSSNQTPFIDVTAADGQFVVVGAAGVNPIGLNQIGAAALTTDATGKTSASLDDQDAVANVSISVSTVPLGVDSITPASNAQNMIATTPITVTFNKPVASSSITGSTFTLSTAAGNPVLGNITVLAGNRVVVFTPATTLAASTNYKVTLSRSIKDIYGHALPADFNSTFATAATVTASNRLRPEQIVIGYPDANGVSSISIPAGSVPEGSSILVLNTTNGSTVSTVAGTSSLTLQIQARVGDELSITITQPDGTQYQVSQAAYRRADGFTSVGANGGTITSADGTLLLQVPAGAISGQADLKLSLAPESAITIPRTGEMDPSIAPYAGGVKIEAQGNFTNTKELHIELPAPANATEGQRVFFMKQAKATFNGQEEDVWETVTSGKVENGRIKSTSPPFIGVTLVGALVGIALLPLFCFMPIHVRAVTGIVQKVNPGEASTPIPGVRCTVTSSAGNHPSIIAYTRDNGRFGLANFAFTQDATVTVEASDNAGVSHLGVATPYLNTEPGLIGIQTLFATVNFPADYQGLNPSVLQFEGQMLNLESGQRDTLRETGRVVTGSRIKVKLTATPVVADFTGDLLVNGASPSQLVWSKTTQNGSSIYETEIEVVSQGTYSVAVTTYTVDNHPETKATATYNFIALSNPNVRPSLPGAPSVLSVTPLDKAQQVDVGTKIRIEFSEPVKKLTPGSTVYLTQTNSGARFSGTITSGSLPVDADTPNISTIDFEPEQKLEGGKEYKVTVTTAVVDSDGQELDQQPSVPDKQEFTSKFKTFQGLVLTPEQQDDASYRIAALGDYAITAHVVPSSAYTPIGELTVYDVSKPQEPNEISHVTVPHRPLAVALAEDTFQIRNYGTIIDQYKRIALVTTTPTPDIVRPNNLWIYRLDDPEKPYLIGVVSLSVPEALTEIPAYVTVHNKRAYIGAVNRSGVIVIDLEQALADFYRDVLTVPQQYGPQGSPQAVLAVTPQGGYDREAQKQKASYGSSTTDPTPVMGLSVIDQVVMKDNVPRVVPVAYVVPNRSQLISFNLDAEKDGILNYYDGDNDGRDDRVLVKKDLSPAGYPVDIKAESGLLISGTTKDLAVELGADRFWIFDVTHPATPTQYPSKTFVDLGLDATDVARRFELEDKLMYVMFSDKVAVIDISDPTKPYVTTTITGLGTGLRWIAVQDGFIYTLANDGGIGQSGFHVSIGRAVAQVIAYGLESASPNICGNPIVVDRNTNRTAQTGAIFYQVYGHDLPKTSKVIIRRVNISGPTPVETILESLPGVTDSSSSPNIVAGEAVWVRGQLIDQSYIYTAEVVLDEGQGTEFHSKKTEIPLSYLVPYFGQPIGVKKLGEKQTGNFGYLLAGTATIKLEIEGVRIPLKPRYHPEGVEADIWERPFGQGKESFDLPAPKPEGSYRFVFTATLKENPEVSDVIEGEVVIGNASTDVRKPGSPVMDGVELGSGNLALSVSDIEVKGRGLSLSLDRYYNSSAAGQFNALGYGWRHSWEILLTRTAERDDAGNLTGEVHYSLDGAEGGRQTFKESKLANGKMPAEAPHVGSLVKNGDGSFDYFTKSHNKYHFRQALEAGGETYENLYYIGNLDYLEEPNGNKISLRYDGFGRMDQVKDSSNRTLKFEYELAETPFVGIIPGDASTGGCARRDKFKSLLTNLQQSRTGRAWRVTRVSGPGGLSVTYEYDEKGNLNFVRRAGYDDISSLTSDRVWKYAYNPGDPSQARFEHLLKKVTAPNDGSEISRVTNYEYDLSIAALLPIKKINLPEGVTESFSYQYADNNTRITGTDFFDGNNQKTSYTLDAGGRPTSIVGPRGDATTLTWTDFGQIKSKLDPEGLITNVEYDENQNVRWTTSTGLGQTIRIGTKYDQTYSKLIQLQDGNNNFTNYSLDGHGNVLEIELPTGRSIVFDYLSNGDLQRIVDEFGFATTFENYDPYGNARQITRQTGSGSVITQNTFDERSRLLTSQDTLEPSVANSYDALDRIVSQTVTDPSGYRPQLTMTAQYLPEGQPKTVSRSGGGQSRAQVNKYDGLSRLRQTTETVSGAGAFVLNYTYDNNSNLLTETNRRGVTVSRTYDALNFVRSITYSGSNGAPVTTWDASGGADVDKVGNPRRVKDQYGQVTEFEYDGLHRLNLRKFPGGYTEQIAYDNNNNVVSTKDRNNRETTSSFDSLNRIVSKHDPAGRVTTWTYDDASNSVTRELAPQGLTEISRHDALGRLLSRQVRFGSNDYTTTNVYSGRQVTTTDARGTVSVMDLSAFREAGRINVNGANPAYAIEQHYGVFGGVESSKDALNRTTNYTLDGFNRATQISYPGGVSEQFAYDGEGLVVSHTDRRGTVVTMSYDNVGRPLTQQASAGTETVSVFTRVYDDANNSETLTDANNHATRYIYDGLHRVKQLVNADNQTKHFIYDGMDLLSEEDFKGKLTTYAYDNVDRLTQIKDRTGQITNIANGDNGGYTRSLTDRRGNQQVEIYDPLGRLTRVTEGGELLTRYEYDSANNRTLVADGRNNQSIYTYDRLNRVKTINHASLQTETFTYDAVGNAISYNDGRGADVSMSYDELNHLKTRSDGEGNTTSYSYDGEGLLLSRTDPKGASYKTNYEYNALGSLVKLTDAKSGIWQFGYDGVQNLKSVRDALNRTVSYDYDALNRLHQIIQPQDRTTTYGYDANSNRISVSDPKGQTTAVVYDDLDRPLTVSYANTTGPGPRSYSYTYDPEGNITRVDEQREPAGARSYLRSYDARNRLRTTTDPFGHTVTMVYDAANNLTSLKDAEQTPTSYVYDGRNRLQTVTMSGGSAAYNWYPDGLLQRVEYGADMKREYSYDNADRITQITNTVGAGTGAQVQQFGYSYDTNSNRATETRSVDGRTTRSITYGYDLLDRLTAAGYATPGQRPANPPAGQSVTYAETTTRQTGFDYDAVGNRTLATAQEKVVNVTLTADQQGNVTESRANNDGPVLSATSQFDNLNRLTNLTAGSVETVYAYDNNGNLTSTRENNQLTGTYEYDVRDQLRRVLNGSNQETASFDYDCERQRLAKTTASGTLKYVYAGKQVVDEYGSSNQLLNRFDVGSGEVIRAELGGEGSRYYFSDAQGSTTALAQKAAGAVPTSYTAGYEYDAWGQYFATSGSSYNSIGYTGQHADYETGLMPLGNGERYYSPAQGRFIQQDSLMGSTKMAQSLNRYGYALGNPTRYVDPTGHKHKERVDNSDALLEAMHGFAERLVNTVAEPFRFAADQIVEYKARQEGIDRKYVKLSSGLGIAVQQAVNAGKDPTDVYLQALKGMAYGAVTFGIGPLYEGASNDLEAYQNGWITRAEFYHQVGAHTADASIILITLALGAEGGAALEGEALLEGTAIRAAERVPLSTRFGNALESYLAESHENMLGHIRNGRRGELGVLGEIPEAIEGQAAKPRKFGPVAGESEPNWGSLVREWEGEPPVEMPNPHGHHTVFKKGRGQLMRQYLEESKDILEHYDIDWYRGRENLGWAPNKNHSTAAAKAVRDALRDAHQNFGTKEAVLDALTRMKEHFQNDTIRDLFDE